MRELNIFSTLFRYLVALTLAGKIVSTLSFLVAWRTHKEEDPPGHRISVKAPSVGPLDTTEDRRSGGYDNPTLDPS